MGVQSVANRKYGHFCGARFGVVCHNGSYRFWEWTEAKTAFVPLVLSSHRPVACRAALPKKSPRFGQPWLRGLA